MDCRTAIGNTIACLGEAMLEISPTGGSHYALGIAGDVLNTAAGISLLGGHSAFVSATGSDQNSALLGARCEQFKVSTRHLERDNSASIGLYLIANDASGERFFSYWRDHSAAHHLFSDAGRLQETLEALGDIPLVYLSGITLSRTSPASREVLWHWLAQYRNGGGCVIYDGNYRPALWDSRELALETHQAAIELSSIFLPGVEDELALRGLADKDQVLDQISALQVAEMVVKDGPEPVLVYDEGRCTEVACSPVSRIVDTSGAGDSFNAGYLAGRMKGLEPARAAKFASEVSAMVIQHRGAIPSPAAWQPLREALGQI